MDRRYVNTCLATGAAAAMLSGFPGAARANRDSRDVFPRFGRIRFRYEEEVYTPNQLVFVSDNYRQVIRMKRKFPLANERRSGVLGPTLAREFDGGIDIGDVRIFSRDIFITTRLSIKVGELQLTDGDISFRINGHKLARSYQSDIPTLGNIPVVGHLFRRRDDTQITRNLMVLISPRIMTYSE